MSKEQYVFSESGVLVVGDVMLDRYWFGDTERISPEAPVPVVLVGRSEERLGGAANVALNSSGLGASVSLMGVVGLDEAGRTIQRILSKSTIRDQLLEDPEAPTTLKLRVIARQQQLVRVDFEEKPSVHHLSAKLADFEAMLESHNVVVFSDYGKGSLEHISQMLAMCRQANVSALVDPKGDEWEKYRGAFLLTPNRSEFRQVAGAWRDESHLLEKAHRVRQELELAALLITRSEEGMTLFTDEGQYHVEADAREVYDVSGAGDTVISTLACALGAGYDIELAVRLANRAGGVVVGKLGTAVVLPHELSIEK